MTGKNASSDQAIASILKSIYTGFRNKYVFRQNMKIRTYPPTNTQETRIIYNYILLRTDI
jgi:hypothetical protein